MLFLLSMRGGFYCKTFSNLKNIHFLSKWTEHIPACRHLYRVRLCWLAGAVASSTRDPEDFIIPPSPPSACTSPFPLSLSLHSFHLLFSTALLPLQLCFKCSVLHFLSLSSSPFCLYSSVTLNLIQFRYCSGSIVYQRVAYKTQKNTITAT